jgi:hypothetical protein
VVTVVDSDVLVDDPHETAISQGLTVAQVDGHDDLWSRTQRQALTYCMDAKGFGAAAAEVQAAMTKASGDWEAVANVKFVHLPAEDQRCSRSNARVLFDVRGLSGRPYLARSFFPSSARASREVLIDGTALPPGSWGTCWGCGTSTPATWPTPATKTRTGARSPPTTWAR